MRVCYKHYTPLFQRSVVTKSIQTSSESSEVSVLPVRPGEEVKALVIVLRVRPFRDSDLMVHAFSPDFGKLSLIARHARSSKKRFPAAVDVFDRGTITISRERGGCLAVKIFAGSRSLMRLRSDLDKLTLASVVCESFDVITRENDGIASNKLFEVLDLSLNAIDEATDLGISLRASYIALTALGSNAGITDMTATAPSTKQLLIVLAAIEKFSGRPLNTRNALGDVLKKLTRPT